MSFRPAVLIAVLLAGAAAAADKPVIRPARAADLPGIWHMVAISTSAGADTEDSVSAPYQIFYFDPRGGMKHMTSRKPFRDSQVAMFSAAPLVIRYTVRKGMLELTNPGWDAPRTYMCGYVTEKAAGEDRILPRVGDIVLTALDADGKPAWVKLLRKTH